jgi:hypothetical protein
VELGWWRCCGRAVYAQRGRHAGAGAFAPAQLPAAERSLARAPCSRHPSATLLAAVAHAAQTTATAFGDRAIAHHRARFSACREGDGAQRSAARPRHRRASPSRATLAPPHPLSLSHSAVRSRQQKRRAGSRSSRPDSSVPLGASDPPAGSCRRDQPPRPTRLTPRHARSRQLRLRASGLPSYLREPL